jgi:hypothetical protein
MSDDALPQHSWTVHPLRDSRKRTIFLLVFLALFFTGVYLSFQSISVTILSAICLICSLYRYFVPSHYEFHDDRLVIISFTRQLIKPWSDFRSFYADQNGVLLSPFSRPSRLENFRGVYVHFGGSRRDEILDFIQRKVCPDSTTS